MSVMLEVAVEKRQFKASLKQEALRLVCANVR